MAWLLLDIQKDMTILITAEKVVIVIIKCNDNGRKWSELYWK